MATKSEKSKGAHAGVARNCIPAKLPSWLSTAGKSAPRWGGLQQSKNVAWFFSQNPAFCTAYLCPIPFLLFPLIPSTLTHRLGRIFGIALILTVAVAEPKFTASLAANDPPMHTGKTERMGKHGCVLGINLKILAHSRPWKYSSNLFPKRGFKPIELQNKV